jgi:hypothetical protein
MYYPLKQIIIIDDNSNQEFIKSEYEYKNLTVIQSEYPQRGELLPYIYYLKYKWFQNAVIIHDSLFIHKRIPFETFRMPVIPLWHYKYDKENLPNIIRITSALTNNRSLIRKLLQKEEIVTTFGFNNDKFNLCFGGQSYVNLKFLENIQKKYTITNLLNVIHNRPDRCAFERVIGLLFTEEFPKLRLLSSLFGNIMKHPRAFSYNYNDYDNDFQHKKVIHPFVKVWTGR